MQNLQIGEHWFKSTSAIKRLLALCCVLHDSVLVCYSCANLEAAKQQLDEVVQVVVQNVAGKPVRRHEQPVTAGSICYSPPAHCPPLFRGNQARRATLQRLYGPRALQERRQGKQGEKSGRKKRRLQPCEVLGRRRWRRRARVSTRYVAAHLIRRDLKCRLEIDPTRAEQRQTSLSFLERQ